MFRLPSQKLRFAAIGLLSAGFATYDVYRSSVDRPLQFIKSGSAILSCWSMNI